MLTIGKLGSLKLSAKDTAELKYAVEFDKLKVTKLMGRNLQAYNRLFWTNVGKCWVGLINLFILNYRTTLQNFALLYTFKDSDGEHKT